MIIFTAVIILFYFIKTKRFHLLPYVLAVMMIFFISYTVEKILPEVEKYRPIKELSIELGKDSGTNDRIGVYNMPRVASIAFYTGHHIDWLNSKEELKNYLKSLIKLQ